MKPPVVLLHGVWMPGVEMAFVRHRLGAEHGFDGHLFAYPSHSNRLDENARSLSRFVETLAESDVDLVGHSLGGIVALRALALDPALPVGRIVCLGSPLRGSRAARALYRHRFGRAILGDTLPAATVDGAATDWAGPVVKKKEVGVIAGNTPAGLGRLFADFDGEHDGTVAVSETRLPGIRDHLVLPVSHTGMVFSTDVADQAAAFLRRGEFLRD